MYGSQAPPVPNIKHFGEIPLLLFFLTFFFNLPSLKICIITKKVSIELLPLNLTKKSLKSYF